MTHDEARVGVPVGGSRDGEQPSREFLGWTEQREFPSAFDGGVSSSVSALRRLRQDTGAEVLVLKFGSPTGAGTFEVWTTRAGLEQVRATIDRVLS